MRRGLPLILAFGLIFGLAGTANASAKASCSKTVKKKNGGKCPAPPTTTPPGPIFTQTGSGTAQTATFKVPNNWNLAWTYDCAHFGYPGLLSVYIYDYYAASKSTIDLDNLPLSQSGSHGSGIEHYHSGGNTKYLTINSVCDWTITITKA